VVVVVVVVVMKIMIILIIIITITTTIIIIIHKTSRSKFLLKGVIYYYCQFSKYHQSVKKINAMLTLVISETVHLLKLRVAEIGYSSYWPMSKMMNTSHLNITEKNKRRKQKIRHALDMFHK